MYVGKQLCFGDRISLSSDGEASTWIFRWIAMQTSPTSC